MLVNKIYNEKIYPELKEYVIENSIYSPTVTKIYTEQSKVFPLVVVNLQKENNKFNTLTYGEETYSFKFDINVYSNTKTYDNKKIASAEIIDEISDLVETYFRENYKVNISRYDDIYNIDGNIRRNYIEVSGVLDTKYGLDNLVIYPR